MVRLHSQFTEPVEQGSAGRLVGAVDDQHPWGRALRQGRKVDRAQVGQGLGCEHRPRLHDPARPLRRTRRLRHVESQQLEFADVAAPTNHRCPGDDRIGPDGSSAQEGERASDPESYHHELGDTPCPQGLRRQIDVHLPRLHA